MIGQVTRQAHSSFVVFQCPPALLVGGGSPCLVSALELPSDTYSLVLNSELVLHPQKLTGDPAPSHKKSRRDF